MLYLSLFEEDTEAERLALLPGEREKMEEYKQFFLRVCEEVLEFGLEQAERRKEEQESFLLSYQKAVSANQTHSTKVIEEHNEQMGKVGRQSETCDDLCMHVLSLLHVAQVISAGAQTSEGEDELERLTELHHHLMQLEMQLVDQLEVCTPHTVPYLHVHNTHSLSLPTGPLHTY